MDIAAGEFKSKCLAIMDQVAQSHESVVVTKRGKPIVKVIPYEQEPISLFGCLAGSVVIKADIVAPLDEAWNAEK